MVKKRLGLFLYVFLMSSLGLGIGWLMYAAATVNEVTPAANRYTANGSTTGFAYTFKIYLKTDIEVLVDSVTKTVDVDYSVSGLENAGGGTVTFLAAPANGTTVTILRKQPASQLSTYTPNQPFPSTQVGKDFDKLAMQIQQVRERLDRALTFAKSSTLSGQTVDTPTVGMFARAKSGGGIDWATPTNAGPLSSPVAVADGGTGATTAAGARTNLLNYAENTVIDAKGDLLGGSADNALARVAASSTNGFVLAADSSATAGMSWVSPPMPNPVINGSMDIWQRGVQFVSPSTGAFSADRWSYTKVGAGVVTINRSTTVPTVAAAGLLFNYSLEVDVTTADASIASNDLYTLRHKIEGFNWRPFAQRQITVSFWVSSTKTGIFSFAIRNSGQDRAYGAEYTVNAGNTWEYKTVTVAASPSAGTWDYTNGIGAELIWTLAGGANFFLTQNSWQTIAGDFFVSPNQVNGLDSTSNFFRITGVKLEPGAIASPLQFQPFQDELARCQRYYEKSFNYATAPAQNTGTATGGHIFASSWTGAVTIGHTVPFKVIKRQAPSSFTLYNPFATNALIRNTTDSTDITGSVVNANGESNFVLTGTGGAGLAVGEFLEVHWTAEAEL